MSGPDDERLSELLHALGQRIVLPDTQDSTSDGPAAWRRPPTSSRRTPARWAAVAALAAAIVAATLLIAPVREAVAGWLGIGSTRIEVDSAVPDSTVELPGIETGLPPMDPAEARTLLTDSLSTLDSTALGPPAGFVDMPEGGVLVVWADSTTLWVHSADVDLGLILKKLLSSQNTVRTVDGIGDEALLIEGSHWLATPHRTVTAGNTLIWRRGSTEYRLEADRPPAELIELGRQLAAR